MNRNTMLLMMVVLLFSIANISAAKESAPWGHASIKKLTYQSQKVVYDVDAKSKEHLANVLARTNYLSKLNGDDPFDNKVIVVIHGDAIPYFSITHTKEYLSIMKQAHSQTFNGTIEFRMCQASARLRGFEAKDIHGFVTMVPMADAEIVRLQKAGYAYMR